ncbi:Protein archease [uncultured archaeon]|nr:Protein archease [uncultured archaeon]
MTIRFYDHTADIKFRVTETSFNTLLENASKAMFSVIAKTRTLKEDKQVKIKVKVKKNDELIIRLLSELLTLHQTKELFFKRLKIIKTDKKTFVEAIAYGEKMTPQKGRIDVKAVTFHEFNFSKKDKKLSCTIILDI